MSDTRTRVYTTFPVTVYVEDGKVTGVSLDYGWTEGSVEVEDTTTGDSAEVRSDSPEAAAAFAAMGATKFVVGLAADLAPRDSDETTHDEGDDHCESDGSRDCLVHAGGRFAIIGADYSEVCDFSPDFEEV